MCQDIADGTACRSQAILERTASPGLAHRLRMAASQRLTGRRAIMGADTKSSPDGVKVAELIQSGEGQTRPIERTPGLYESRGVGNSYLITTSDGDVVVNAGTLGDARRGRELFAQV